MLITALAVILRILSNPIANVLQKQLTNRNNHPLLVNFLTFFILSIVCIIPAISVKWSELPAAFWFYSIIAGIFGATGNGFLVKALQGGDLSILGPINSYKSVVGIIVGIFLLGETPSVWGVVGVALIVGGSYFVLDTMGERFSFGIFRNKEIRYRILAMVLTAIEAIYIKKIIIFSSTSISFIMWCWFGALFSFMLLFAFRVHIPKELREVKPAYIPRYIYLVICIGTMQYTTNYVFDHMNVGYALALFQFSTIVSIFLGYRIFKEKDIRKKLLGAVIMIAGSVLIIFME